ncbi:hypothetical protein ANN_15297 [Periplaneta americana]|uniref:Uncharacterized protein n=1 Tax=Periplaneta americana TaxID=6978 RepID=A0ABQ8SGX0_PERAM|nr:hypothetical protein ANN_15297 [Periplaneta americana]
MVSREILRRYATRRSETNTNRTEFDSIFNKWRLAHYGSEPFNYGNEDSDGYYSLRTGNTVCYPFPRLEFDDTDVKYKQITLLGSRAVASWSKASCLGLALRNARWFESSWGKKFSHEISASIWDLCPPSIVMYLWGYDRSLPNQRRREALCGSFRGDGYIQCCVGVELCATYVFKSRLAEYISCTRCGKDEVRSEDSRKYYRHQLVGKTSEKLNQANQIKGNQIKEVDAEDSP